MEAKEYCSISMFRVLFDIFYNNVVFKFSTAAFAVTEMLVFLKERW